MTKRLITAILILAVSVVFAGCSNKVAADSVNNENSQNSNGKVNVVVSFNALKEFAQAVGKDKIDVKVIVPEGTEPHDFEPKPRDMENINNAQVFIYNGLNMETWVDKTLSAVDNKKLLSVDASKNIDVINTAGQTDPHIWLSLRNAQIEAKNILDALVKVDGKNKAYYERNYTDFSNKLKSLDENYNSKFEAVSNKDFVTGHAAFAYLCRDYKLTQNSVEDVFAEGEPTPKKLKDLVDYCKGNNIKVIFMEELASPKVSETLAKEVGAKVEKIYTIESKEDGKDYIQSMKDNLDMIYNSLK
ncbi:metal ABC transporter substrate-binding protein [Candidatus Clostridium stratigraminis]|uniref:Metal ABC transporter substrate-binding protein n=1 Tax=Candidatus Clostridium stratigraminis TaxID=3381661 RepID=A0ABW8T804_9CLOT